MLGPLEEVVDVPTAPAEYLYLCECAFPKFETQETKS